MSDIDRKVWDLLMEEIGNAYGVAGLMGNLMAESSMNPCCHTGGKYGSSIYYPSLVYNGTISRDEFAHDGTAFGLAQWCYWSRKQALYDFTKENGLDINDSLAQIKFLLKEIKSYKTVWKTLKEAKSIGEASDMVLLRYEKPANTSDKVKAKRQLYGQQFYEEYANTSRFSNDELIQILDDVLFKVGKDLTNGEIDAIGKIMEILKEG